MAWIDEMRAENADVATAAFAGLGDLAGHLGGTASPNAGALLLAMLNGEYSAVADTATAATLAGIVDSVAARLDRETPGRYADSILGGDS